MRQNKSKPNFDNACHYIHYRIEDPHETKLRWVYFWKCPQISALHDVKIDGFCIKIIFHEKK
jgi:hypothetical protein